MTMQSLRARPIFFGNPERRLFGVFHPPAKVAPARAAVLLCKPFGQEAINAHRVFRVLAERLARNGHPVLRFDYFGTGDSDGDDTDVSLDSWRRDIDFATMHLRELTSDSAITWLGLRLGATAAWFAAAQSIRAPKRLLLWDPICDGRHYLAALRRGHAEAVRAALNLPSQAAQSATDVIEAIGFAIAPAFASELDALACDALPSLPAQIRTVVIAEAAGQTGTQQRLVGAGGTPLRKVEISHGMDWMSEGADNGVLVPAQALQGLLSLAGETA